MKTQFEKFQDEVMYALSEIDSKLLTIRKDVKEIKNGQRKEDKPAK